MQIHKPRSTLRSRINIMQVGTQVPKSLVCKRNLIGYLGKDFPWLTNQLALCKFDAYSCLSDPQVTCNVFIVNDCPNAEHLTLSRCVRCWKACRSVSAHTSGIIFKVQGTPFLCLVNGLIHLQELPVCDYTNRSPSARSASWRSLWEIKCPKVFI